MRGERDILFYFLEEFEFPTSHIADVARMNISPRNSSRNVLKYDQYFIKRNNKYSKTNNLN